MITAIFFGNSTIITLYFENYEVDVYQYVA